MPVSHTLSAQPRDTAVTPRALRRNGFVPGVVYGKQFSTIALQFNEPQLRKVLGMVGTTHLMNLEVEGGIANETVLVRDVQRDPINGALLHIDLYRIMSDQLITTEIGLHAFGEAPAVILGGTIMVLLDALQVECLPGDLPDRLTVDLSALTDMDSVIRVEDLPVPQGVTVLTDADTVVARVVAQRGEEEQAPAAAGEASAEEAE
jgi:large subunit ribosomal protein L25